MWRPGRLEVASGNRGASRLPRTLCPGPNTSPRRHASSSPVFLHLPRWNSTPDWTSRNGFFNAARVNGRLDEQTILLDMFERVCGFILVAHSRAGATTYHGWIAG
jgi:hypothetical protein